MGKKLEKAVKIVLDGTTNPKDIMREAGVSVATAYAAIKEAEHKLEVARASLKALPKKKSIVGIISDTHIPFEHPRALEHCLETFEKFNVDTIVHIGDLVDHHAASRFQTEYNAMNIEEELAATRKAIKPWTDAFPKVKLCLGNHDRIPARQAKAVGMSPSFVKNLHDLYDLPSGWEADMQFVIDDVMYEHGVGSNGQYGAKNTAMRVGTSYVQGHTHQHAGCHYISRHDGSTIFGLNVGCLAGEGMYNTVYAMDYKGKVTLGCGVVHEGDYGMFIPLKG